MAVLQKLFYLIFYQQKIATVTCWLYWTKAVTSIPVKMCLWVQLFCWEGWGLDCISEFHFLHTCASLFVCTASCHPYLYWRAFLLTWEGNETRGIWSKGGGMTGMQYMHLHSDRDIHTECNHISGMKDVRVSLLTVISCRALIENCYRNQFGSL